MSIFSLNLKKTDELLKARDVLDYGDPLIIATDTVPGLSVSLKSSESYVKLLKLKGYKEDRPFTWHFPSISALQKTLRTLPPGISKWLEEVLTKKCTVIVPKEWLIMPENIKWPFPNIGIRVPQNIEWQTLFKGIATPVLATSANKKGNKPLTGKELKDWATSKKINYSKEAILLKNAPASNVLDLSQSKPTPLRGEWPKGIELPGKKILIVCTGNTCRSPLAAEILKQEIKKTWGLKNINIQDWGWEVHSAGLSAQEGAPANKKSQLVAQEINLNLSTFRSKSLFSFQEESFDEVLGMTFSHQHQSINNFQLLDPRNKEIEDPFGGDIETYRRARKALKIAITKRVQLWQKNI